MTIFKNQSFTIAHSDDMELIEVISPADFPTQEDDAP